MKKPNINIMPFDSRKQQQWYHATDQTYLDDKPHKARKVKGEVDYTKLTSCPQCGASLHDTIDGKSKKCINCKWHSDDGLVSYESEFGDKDLTTTASGDINPEDKNMETPVGSAREYYIVSSTKTGEYSEEEVDDLEKAKSLANDWDGVVTDSSGNRVYVSSSYTGEVTQEEKEAKRNSDDILEFEGEYYKKISKEELSVSGPPADSFMRTPKPKEEENLTDTDLTSNDLTSHTVGESDSLLFEGFLFVPAKEGHVEKESDIIFENKLYTCEGLGNCNFCGGKGKITVEKRGLKDCPDCDGTGNVGEQTPEQPMESIPQKQEGESLPPNYYAKKPDSNDPEQIWKDLSYQQKKDLVDWAVAGDKEAETFQSEPKTEWDHLRGDVKSTIGHRLLTMGESFSDSWECVDCDKNFNYRDAVDHINSTGHDIVNNNSTKKCPNCDNPVKEPYYHEDYAHCTNCGNKFKWIDAGESCGCKKAKESKERMVGDWWNRNPDKRSKIPNAGRLTSQSWDSLTDNQRSFVTAHADPEVYAFESKGNKSKSKANELSMRTYYIIKNGKEIDSFYGDITDAYKLADSLGADQIYDAGYFYMTDYGKGSDQKSWTRKDGGKGLESKRKAQEASISKYKNFINTKIKVLKSHARAGESVSLMYGLPSVEKQGKKIKGTLAYAGVSLNDRIYLPEELAKGHGKTLPLLLNHSNVAGAEDELYRLDDNMRSHLENEEDYQVGEVTLTWDPERLTLFYEGVVDHPFFQKEIDDMDMAVSLGIYYDSDSPEVCNDNCYTLIKGAEFREVSLVYHAGFPIATIEAVEAELKQNALKAHEEKGDVSPFSKDPKGSKEEKERYDKYEAEEDDGFGTGVGSGYFKTDVGYVCKICNTELGTDDNMQNHIKTVHSKANEDSLLKVDEEPEGTKVTVLDEWDKKGAQEDHFERLEQLKEEEQAEGEPEHAKDVQEIIDDIKEETEPKEEAEEEIDVVPRESDATAIDVEPKEEMIVAESFFTNNDFSVRGVAGMTVSNTNGVQKYKLDPNMSYETNMIHFNVSPKGAHVFGEGLQMSPKMTTPPSLTKEIESMPDINVTTSDEDAFKKKLI